MKSFDKNKIKRKFSTYKKTFSVFIGVFLLSVFLSFVLTRRGMNPFPLVFFENGSIFGAFLFFMTVFLSGPTIYAPAASFFTLLLFGLSSGTVAGLSGNIASAVMLFFDFVIGYILTVYSSFVTLTSMKIFTLEKEPALEGVLFSAKRFRGIFNFRFVLSYILFFVLFSVAGLFVFIIKTQLLTLI